MKDIQMRTFETVGEFAATAADLLKGPAFAATFLTMDAKFREKVILCVSIANNCGICGKFHTVLGLRAGLTEEDVHKLVALRKKDFPRKEWLALRWARDWAGLRGKSPANVNARAYEEAYSLREREYVEKICRMMKMANYSSNFLFAVPFLEDGTPPRKGLLGRLGGPVERALDKAVLKARTRTAQAADACADILGAARSRA